MRTATLAAAAVTAGGCCLASTYAFVPSQTPVGARRAPATSRAESFGRMRMRMVATEEEAARVAVIHGFTEKIKQGARSEESGFSKNFLIILEEFLDGYTKCALRAGTDPAVFQRNVGTLLKAVPEQLKAPFQFELFHPAIRAPFDMYAWGNSFFEPLVDMEHSKLGGRANLEKIAAELEAGDNVFLLSNHQTEADPQVISLLMEREGFGAIASRLINVAGHRVTTDPLAIPFSMGRNLFCIYSKKYMESPPELKSEKQRHNIRTLKKMADMMSEGSQFIWVAPSGGRDRPDPATGAFTVASFDPKSVEVFRLMAAKVSKKRKTRFYPFAMWTNKLVPPPDEVNKELGERRQADRGPVSVAFGEEIIAGEGMGRAEFAAAMEAAVKADYAKLDAFHRDQDC